MAQKQFVSKKLILNEPQCAFLKTRKLQNAYFENERASKSVFFLMDKLKNMFKN